MGKIAQNPISKILKNHTLPKLITVLILAITTGLLIISAHLSTVAISNYSLAETFTQKTHPLPSTLAKWQDPTNSGDYFEQVIITKVGHLIWSRFPVTVKIETPTNINEKQGQTWVNAVAQVVQEWNNYLPLQIIENSENADITIFRKSPPLQIDPNSRFPRARSALTTYEFFTNKNILSHRFTILLSPSQKGNYLQAAARHELGHALGIWGHSPLKTDALYFSQVRNPANISARDVNTLKRIYQQPTGLGWKI